MKKQTNIDNSDPILDYQHIQIYICRERLEQLRQEDLELDKRIEFVEAEIEKYRNRDYLQTDSSSGNLANGLSEVSLFSDLEGTKSRHVEELFQKLGSPTPEDWHSRGIHVFFVLHQNFVSGEFPAKSYRVGLMAPQKFYQQKFSYLAQLNKGLEKKFFPKECFLEPYMHQFYMSNLFVV